MLKIDHYSYINGLKNVHPAEKVGFAFVFLLFTIVTKNGIIASITFVVMSISILFAAKIPLLQYIKLLILPFIFLIISIVTMIISIAPNYTVDSNVLWYKEISSWTVYISLNNIQKAIILVRTVIASISCLYFLILTTSFNQLMWVLRKVCIPNLLIDLIGITYHFIFVFFNKIQEIFLAQSSRLGYRNYKVGMTSAAQLVVTLFIKSIQSAREMQFAIASRGGDERLFKIEINLFYSRSRCVGIILSLIALLIITFLTK